MAYQALYRKWRPLTFDDVVGQEHITTTLRREIAEGRVAHAYLFTGTRGTGKTSTAKIFSRAVNCLHPHNGNPCNECEICTGILDESILDVVEMDAASNTGVENIRSVIEQVQYAAAVSRYRVYIIDEVHMLSTGAFNALLKTLEEPPAHVIFILATTEIHKVPATILSRCQRFDFKTITGVDIANRLEYILSQENIRADKDALSYVAHLGDGSMRDSLSILDQCLAFCGNDLTYTQVADIVGALDDSHLFSLAKMIAAGDVAGTIKQFDECMAEGRNCDHFVSGLLDVYRELLMAAVTGIYGGYSPRHTALLEETAGLYTKERLLYCIDVLSALLSEIKSAVSVRVMIEVALIKLANPALDDSNAALLARIAELEQKMVCGVPTCTVPVAQPVKPQKEPIEEELPPWDTDEFVPPEQVDYPEVLPATPAVQEEPMQAQEGTSDAARVVDNWKDVMNSVSAGGALTLYMSLFGAKPYAKSNQLVLLFEREDQAKNMSKPENMELLCKHIVSVTGVGVPVVCECGELPTESEQQTQSGDIFSNIEEFSRKFPKNIHVD